MSRSSPPPRRRDDLEEGEIATDSGSDSPRDDDGDRRPEIQGRRLEQRTLVAGGGQVDALPSPTPSSECDSDGTVSDVVGGGALGRTTEQLFPCPICLREFRSVRAVSGHMRMHDPQERQGRPAAPAIAGGWAVRGRRGFVGGRSASPEDEAVVDSMALAVGEPVVDPVPFALASRSNSVEPDPNPNVSSTAIAAAAAAQNPPYPNEVAVHPSCSPQFVAHNQPPEANQVVVLGPRPQPVVDQRAPATPPQFTANQPAPPPPAPSPPVRDEQGWWVCKLEGCAKRFHTYQGLGGHMASHKNRQTSEAAAAGVGYAGAAASARPARMHSCNICGVEYDAGTKLGGHKRKHYSGKVIPRKRAAREPQALVSAGELAVALSSAVQASSQASMAMEGPELQLALPSEAPVPAPEPASSIRIFGVTMTPHVQSPAATSSTVMETDQSSGETSTNTQ